MLEIEEINTREINVDFFTTSKYEISPTFFTTVSENVIKKEAYHEGATFELVIEEVLTKERAYSYRVEGNDFSFQIMTDQIEGKEEKIDCHTFPMESTEIPPQYGTREYYIVLEDGEGDFVEAEYEERTYQKVLDIGGFEEIENEDRLFTSYKFIIDDNVSFEDYFMSQIDDEDFFLDNDVNYRIR